MKTLFYAGFDGQACRVEYGLAPSSGKHVDGVDIVVVHSPRLGPVTSLIVSEEARNLVLNRILSTQVTGIRLDLIRYFVLFEAQTLGETRCFEFPIALDFDDYKKSGRRVFTDYPIPAALLGRILWGLGLRPRRESVWNKDAIAGSARCYTRLENMRQLVLEEVKLLCDSVGHRPMGQYLPKWLTDQVAIPATNR